ncbi:hypothetical protein BGZ76_008558 [Entomortierella beljakovae]|nr:hypothetical protein BGZ76_008558 [Entomortierella beljakovae]
METIYGIQADTETLREAHERNKRLQQRHQEQSSVTDKLQDISLGKLKSPPKHALSARSASTSALPSNPNIESAVPATKTGTKANLSGTQHQSSGSTATSPFFGAVDHHGQHPTAAEQLRSATHSPAFLSKFYDADHRIPSSIPWLALPGAATPTLGGTESPVVFGRRRSDVGLSSSGTSTPLTSDKHALESSQQENPHPHPPQPQPHYHHHHLLTHQELSELSRTNTPLPINEAIPSYLKKGADSLHSMERSLSNPGSNIVHTAPTTPFMLPFHPPAHPATTLPATAVSQASMSNGHVASPSHLLFPFSGSTQTSRPEMERSSSTGVLPMNRQHQNQSRHQQYRNPAQFGGNQGTPTSMGHLPSVIGNTSVGTGPSTNTFFRTSTPLGASPSLIGYSPHPTTFGPTPTKLNPFGHPSDSNLPSNKEVHA